MVIADTGIKGSTSKAVSDVRQGFQENKEGFSALFNQIGQLVESAKKSFINGDLISLGKSLSENHQLLQNLGVSCNQLDTLVEEALSKGALGAKLSGGGQGGNMIALVNSDQAEPMASALLFKGAVNTLITHIPAKGQ